MQTPGLPGGPGIPFSGKASSLLMPGKNCPDFFGPRQGLMDRHAGPARISENYLYTLPLHGGDKDFGAIHRFTSRGGLTCRGRLFCSRGLHKRVGYYKGSRAVINSLQRTKMATLRSKVATALFGCTVDPMITRREAIKAVAPDRRCFNRISLLPPRGRRRFEFRQFDIPIQTSQISGIRTMRLNPTSTRRRCRFIMTNTMALMSRI